MKKFNLKQLAIICLIVMLNFNITLATTVTGQSIYDYYKNANVKSDLDFSDLTNNLLGAIVWIGYAAAICVLLVTGIQFMVATPQKKAQLKEKLWIILLGVVMLVGGVTIINVVATIFQGAASAI